MPRVCMGYNYLLPVCQLIFAIERQDMNHVKPSSIKHDNGMFNRSVKPYAGDY